MTADAGNALIRVAADVAAPLFAATDPEGLRRLLFAAGWVEFGGLDVAGIATALEDVTDELTEALADPPSDVVDVARLIGRLAEPAQTIADAVTADLDAPPELVEDVAEVLLVTCLSRLGPLLPILELVGVAERMEVPDFEANGWRRRARRRTELHFDRLSDLVRDPLARLRQLAADPGVIAAAAWPLVTDAIAALDIGATTADTDPIDPDVDELRRILVVDLPIQRVPPDFVRAAIGLDRDPVTGLEAFIVVSPGLAWQVQRGGWRAVVSLPGLQRVRLAADGITVAGSPVSITVEVGYESSATPALRFGSPEAMSLTVAGLDLEAKLRGAAGELDAAGSLKMTGIRLAVQGADGLLAFLLGTGPAAVEGDLAVAISASDGASFEGSRAPRLQLAGRRSIGPIDLVDVTVELLIEGGLGVEVTAGIVARLGPMTVRVDRFGLQARLQTDGQPAAPLPIVAGLRPPSGVGAVIAAGPVTGGGYLFADWDAGVYAGVVQLQFKALSLTAIGLVNTKLPGNRPGWSFLVLVAVEFPGIPLGFGISLYAIGGLFGINRTIDTPSMRDAVRAGRLDSILFPRDPVTNSAQVLADLARIFPTEEGRFTIGVMARLGWGPGPLVTIEAGLVVELPSPVRLVVLARLRAVLPTPDDPLVQLRLDVAGIVDFGRGDLSVDGAMIASRIGPFSLAGEMALRASWGATKHFALAAGGFHPRFAPPDGFPTLRRMTISLADAENPRLRLETYLAVTAATVQVGARLEVWASIDVLGMVISAEAVLGFDALVHFEPRFGFEVDVYGSVVVAVNRNPILTAAVELSLSGTAPWHAHGRARASIAFLPEVAIEIDVTVGEPDPVTPMVVEITPRILEALGRPEALEALPVQPGPSAVVLRQPAQAERTAHPGARVAIRQPVAPLGPTLTRLGSAVPTDPGVYTLEVALGGAVADGADLLDTFCPAQFQHDSPERVVTRPQFESLPAGKVLSSSTRALATGAQSIADSFDDRVVGPVDTEAVLLAKTRAPTAATAQAWATAAADRLTARPGAPERYSPRLRPPRLEVTPELWVVSDPDTLEPLAGEAPASAVEADERAAAHHAQGRNVVAIPVFEVAAP